MRLFMDICRICELWWIRGASTLYKLEQILKLYINTDFIGIIELGLRYRRMQLLVTREDLNEDMPRFYDVTTEHMLYTHFHNSCNELVNWHSMVFKANVIPDVLQIEVNVPILRNRYDMCISHLIFLRYMEVWKLLISARQSHKTINQQSITIPWFW